MTKTNILEFPKEPTRLTKFTDLFDLQATGKYLSRIGAEPRKLLEAVVQEPNGEYFRDVAIIKFAKDGAVDAPEGYEPDEIEQAAIRAEFAGIDWPISKPIPNLSDPKLPPLGRDAPKDKRFEFRNADGEIVMLQVRTEKKGKKSFVPITAWSDGEYRFAEPDGPLPLFNLERVRGKTTVFIHEGAGPARRGQAIADGNEPDHPWALEMSLDAAHIGWIGGALSPHRTDFPILEKMGVKTVYIVADNDEAGNSAIVKISKQLEKTAVFAIEFEKANWPTGFDLGDDFPEKFWEVEQDDDGKEHKRYIGPTFQEMISPATYMTTEKLVSDGDGKKEKKVWSVRPEWLRQWRYSSVDDQYLNIHNPRTAYKPAILSKIMQPFQHHGSPAATTYINGGDLLNHVGMFEYRPDQNYSAPDQRDFGPRKDRRFNTFEPTRIKPVKGDTSLFHEFMAHALEDEKERRESLRWLYTFAAQPQIKMKYGILLISNQTATGKSTFLTDIAVPLGGSHNSSQPSNEEIQNSDFTDWLYNKRLVVVDECYLGGGQGQRKFSNRLKTLVSQEQVWINPKGVPGKTVRNFAMFGMSSNSFKAAYIDEKDRRWFIPTWTEVRWPAEKFKELHNWLKRGGLSALLYEAQNLSEVPGYDDLTYVQVGEHAPDSSRKQEIVRDGRTEVEKKIIEIAELAGTEEKVCFPVEVLEDFIKNNIDRKLYSSEEGQLPIKITLENRGWICADNNEKGKGPLDGWKMADGKKKINILISPALIETAKKKKTPLMRPFLKTSQFELNEWYNAMSGEEPY